jgi:hypothetical protein
MILDMKGRITTSQHLICFSNKKMDMYLSTYPKLRWTDNFNFARCYETTNEAHEFLNNPIVKSFLGDEIVNIVWTDSKECINLE